MKDVLSEIGYDLATRVKEQSLPVTSLDILKPTIYGYRFFDYLILHLGRVMNSAFLVGENIDYIDAYINSLSLLIADPIKSFNDIRLVSKSMRQELALDEPFNNTINQEIELLKVKRLYKFDILDLMQLGNTFEKWNDIFSQLIRVGQQNNYFYVISNVNKLFASGNDKLKQHQARSIFFATRGKSKLTFLAPLTWRDYVNDIENGNFTFFIKHCARIFFSPRPSNLSLPLNKELVPDVNFDFD